MTENIGYKLRRLREDHLFSIESLAEQSGIQATQIEEIERGEMIPSLAILIKLARTLGMRLGTFLDGMECPDLIVSSAQQESPRPTVYLSKEESTDMEHLRYRLLAEHKPDRNMEPCVITIDYSDLHHESVALSQHEGEEFIYVLDGSIEIRYGDQFHQISKGASIYYDSIVPHALSSSVPDTKAKVLAVLYTPF